MLQSRQILNARLEHRLGSLVSSVEIAIRANLASSNVAAENTLMELLNRIHGWDLVNANSVSQNYPGVDLIDEQRKIAVQVTSTRTPEKVRHTRAQVSALGVTFRRVIVLFISSQSVTPAMKDCAGTMELWSMPDVFRDAIALDTDRLREIVTLMDKELGTIRGTLEALPHLDLSPGSRLESSGFVGREKELADIRSRFAAGDQLVVLTGLGGMGKTELAVHYAQDHSGIVHFVRFDTSFTRTLANMARAIRPELSEEALREDETARSRRVLALLKGSHPGDLLIIDNADGDTGNLADLQRDPGYGALMGLPLKLLITTRSHAPRAIRVEPMSEDNLKKIFRNHGASLSDREMTDLIRAVNGHTMTIDLIARTLTARGWRQVRAEQILTALREHTLPSQKYQAVTTDYSQSPEQAQIYTHLSVVFDVSGVPGDGRQVLRCATLLPEDGMNGELFGLSLAEARQNALDDLLERGWLEVNNGLLTIHPVIRLVCREELQPGDECGDFLDALWDQFDPKEYDRVKYAQMAEVFAGAVEIARSAETKADWLNNSGRLWGDLMESRRAVMLYEQYLPVLEQQLPDHPALATAYNNMGSTYGDLGDHNRELEFQLKALAICEKVLPQNHPDLALALAYNNVGCTYGHLGNHNKALEFKLKALAICERVLPQNHPDLATSYNNVGTTYGKLGDHNKALVFQLKDLAICEKLLPENHPDLALSYNNVGSIYGNLGDHNRALEFKLKALAICEKVLPQNHPHLALSYNNVGTTYGYLGKHNKALEFKLKALTIREKVLPENHPSLATSCNNIAWTYYKLGQLPEAAQYMRRAADIISRSSLPEDHPNRVNYTRWAARLEEKAKAPQ